ncbi:MAG: type VI secretion system ImpA family N-terminal domain-containing protein, partial [bacterium]|nr:type VI secretion system ImpA family N-terminal domain-containing protein [bacterium]
MSNEYSTLGSDPVSESNPIGEDVRYEADFEWLEEEIGKLSKPVLKQPDDSDSGSSGARFVYLPVDWNEVVTVGNRVLREQSKDIRVAVWYAMGLSESRGFAGAAEGLAVCTQIMQSYWDSFYPQRDAIRTASIRQLFDYLNERLKGKEPATPFSLTGDDIPHLEAANKFTEDIDNILKEKMPDTPPMVGVLQSQLENKAGDLKKNAAPPPPPPAPPTQEPETAPPATDTPPPAAPSPAPAAPVPAVQSAPKDYDFAKPGDRFKYFSDLHVAARTFHEYGLTKIPMDPVAYRWIRMVYWSPVEYTQDVTMVPIA